MTEPISSTSSEVRRIDSTGTIWFAAALIAGAIIFGPVLVSGWRPSDLPDGAQFVWWAGLIATFVSLPLLCWAGCPVLRGDLEKVDQQKALSIRVGVVLLMVGSAAQLLAVLMSPAG